MHLRGGPMPAREHWRSALIIGTLLLLGGNGLVCLAELRVASSLAALVVATVPFWMVALPWLLGGSRPPLRTLIALLSGLLGVGLLTVPGSQQGIDPLGATLLLTASFSWAVGSLVSRQLPHPPSPLVATSLQMICGGAALLLAGAAHGDLAHLQPHEMTTASWLSVAYLITMGSIVGFGSYVFLLRHTSGTLATSYSYVNPLVALALGCLLHHEPLGSWTPLATVLIIGAVVAMSRAHGAARASAPGSLARAPTLDRGEDHR